MSAADVYARLDLMVGCYTRGSAEVIYQELLERFRRRREARD